MAYQALYRKYRPLDLNSVVGQEVIVKTIKNAIKRGSISHAYLFCGPRGTGKTTIAKIMAKTINCLDNNNGIPCNKCEICQQLANGQGTDIIEIDAASNNGVDEIREIRNKVNLVPSFCKYKVYIIDEVHMLSTGAFNALLKTLEEPPAHVIFILATTEPHKLPLTIISRCQRFDFKKISVSQIIDHIKYIAEQEKIKIETAAINKIAFLSDGGMRDAISLLDQLASFEENIITSDDVDELNGMIDSQTLEKLITSIIKGDVKTILNMSNYFDHAGKDFFRLVDELIVMIRDIMIYKYAPEEIESNSKKKIITNLAKIDSNYDYFNLITIFNECQNDIKNSNHSKIIFETYILKSLTTIQIEKAEIKSVGDTQTADIKKTPMPDIKVIDKNNSSPSNIIDPPNVESNLETLKNIRINNTFARADKNILINLKQRWGEIRTYTIDQQYSLVAGLLLDGEVVAAGEQNIIIAFKYKSMSDELNQKLTLAEQLISKLYAPYKIIAITTNEWKICKTEFISKKNNNISYHYINEPDDIMVQIDQQNNDQKDQISNIFGSDLIEIL